MVLVLLPFATCHFATWNVERGTCNLFDRQSDCLTLILSYGYGYGHDYGYRYNDGFHIPALHLTKLTGCQSTAISVAVFVSFSFSVSASALVLFPPDHLANLLEATFPASQLESRLHR